MRMAKDSAAESKNDFLDEDQLREIAEAAADGEVPKVAGLIVGAVVGAASAAAGMGTAAIVPATLSKKLTEKVAEWIKEDPKITRMLEAGEALDKRRALIADIAQTVVARVSREQAELSNEEQARFHQLVIFISRNHDELRKAQELILSANLLLRDAPKHAAFRRRPDPWSRSAFARVVAARWRPR
jgi:hypothetical protein